MSQPFQVYDENLPESIMTHMNQRRPRPADVKDINGMVRDPLGEITNHAAQQSQQFAQPIIVDEDDDAEMVPRHDAKVQKLDNFSGIRGTQTGAANSQKPRQTSLSSTVPVSTESASVMSSGTLFLEIPDIDAPLVNDAQAVSSYCKEIFSYLMGAQANYRPVVNYMDVAQTDINPSMRAILVDWLNEVAQEYSLRPQSLYLAVNLIDRFLSCVSVVRSRLQLVGVTCMLIASKYEEIMPPTVDDFVYITDNTYTRDEILRMESVILNTLQFSVTVVTPLDFLSRFLRAANADPRETAVAQYVLELCLQEYSMIRFASSVMAASAVVLALHAGGKNSWTATMQHYTGLLAGDLRECVAEMLHVYRNAEFNNLQAVREKYSHNRHLRVSMSPAPTSIPSRFV